MKKSYTFLAGLTLCAAASAAVPGAPSSVGFDNYTGTTTDITWGVSSGADSYRVSVYSTPGSLIEKTTTLTMPGAPADWTYTGITESDEIAGVMHPVLSTDGASATFLNPEGQLGDFAIAAVCTGITGTDDNDVIFKIELLDYSGRVMGAGQTYGRVFNQISALSITAAFGLTPEGCAGVRVSTVKTGSNTNGSITLKSATYNYRDRQFVVRDAAAQTPPLAVTGLDDETVYYAFVKGVNADGESTPSPILTIDGFLPVSTTDHTIADATSYTATWNAVPKAEGYYVKNYLVEKAQGEQTVFHDTFSRATGSFDDPTSVTSPDDVTDVSGWGGNNMAMADGMFGTTKGAMRPPSRISYLESPALDLSAADGVYKIHLKARGTAGDNLSIYRKDYVVDGALNIHALTFDAEGNIDETWEMTDGVAGMILRFEESKIDRFMIEEITITQEAVAPKDHTVFHDTFSKSTDGTFAEPVTVTSPDDVTDVSGWGGNNMAAAEGMFGTTKGAMRPPYRISYLESPALDLSAADGVYTIHLKARGTAGDNLSIYRKDYVVDGALNIHALTFDADGNIDETWEMTDGAAGMILRFEESKIDKFMLDEITITQPADAAAATSKRLLQTIKCEGKNNTSHTFAGLETGKTYGFEVEAYRTNSSYNEEKSQTTDLHIVELIDPTSIDGITTDSETSVSICGRTLSVSLTTSARLSVYDLNGRAVMGRTLPAGTSETELHIPAGIYIIRIADRILKIAVK